MAGVGQQHQTNVAGDGVLRSSPRIGGTCASLSAYLPGALLLVSCASCFLPPLPAGHCVHVVCFASLACSPSMRCVTHWPSSRAALWSSATTHSCWHACVRMKSDHRCNRGWMTRVKAWQTRKGVCSPHITLHHTCHTHWKGTWGRKYEQRSG